MTRHTPINEMLINDTKNTVIASRVFLAKSYLQRLRGLMGLKVDAFPHGTALIITPCTQVHTFFMRFSIDVLFLDKNNRVLAAISNLVSNRISPCISKTKVVVELPPGTVFRTGTMERDLLRMIERED